MRYSTFTLQALCAVVMVGSLLFSAEACAQSISAVTPGEERPQTSVETPAPPPDAVLLVATGTSTPAGLAAYRSIKAEIMRALPDTPVIWAYTSEIVRETLDKQGTPVPGVEQALESLRRSGYSNICVQSLHVSADEEFSEMERRLVRTLSLYPEHFGSVLLGRPLLESTTDLAAVTEALLNSVNVRRAPGEAVLFVAHGHEHGRGDIVLSAVDGALHEKDSLAFLASVEGSLAFEAVLAELKSKGVTHVWLHPFMMVAEEQAFNNLLGDAPDSWASQLKAAGLTVMSIPSGMGEIADVGKIFARHAVETTDDLSTFASNK